MTRSHFDYAPPPESRDLARLKSSYQIFVDGQFRDGSGPATKTINPADEQPLAEVAEAGPSDAGEAVAAARPPRGRDAPTTRCGRRCPVGTGPSTCSGSPARSPSVGVSWPCWSRWTTANR